MLSLMGRACNCILACQCHMVVRRLNTDLAAALRPFYFAVHPDFFGKHPLERQTNEESLKQLKAHLEMLNIPNKNPKKRCEEKLLKFYLRIGKNDDSNFRCVQIRVSKKMLDPKMVIQTILDACDLKTVSHCEAKQPKVLRCNLDSWISETMARAQQQTPYMKQLRLEVERLEQLLVERLGVRETRYECGWNIERYFGCLKSLARLTEKHAKHMEALRNRSIVFGAYTGISLDGKVMLFTGDKPLRWLGFISAIQEHEMYLKLVPLYEQALSAVLQGIRIKRRNFVPTTEAKTYANRLLKVLNALNEHLNAKRSMLCAQESDALKQHQLAIVPESDQPKVSFTGLFLLPACCSGATVIDFISKNLSLAHDRMIKYRKDIAVERRLRAKCKQALHLHSLTKDDSVTPDKMILTLRHLLRSESKSFEQISIHVTNYYSVLTDGIICIPWDFMRRKAACKLQ